MTLGPRIDVLHTPTLMASDEAIALASQLNSDTLRGLDLPCRCRPEHRQSMDRGH